MAIVVAELRELASLLTDNTSQQTIATVKSKILSIADNLEKTHFLPLKDIDDILNEIDENVNQDNDMKLNQEEEHTILIEGIEATFNDCIQNRLMTDIFESKLNRETWILLFRKAQKEQLDTWGKKDGLINFFHRMPIPFGTTCQNISEKQLIQIYDSIPKHLTDDNEWGYIHQNQFGELAKWLIKYKTDKNNANKEVFNAIYQAIIQYAYWKIFSDQFKTKTDTETINFYEKYQKYIDINRQSAANENTLLHYWSYYENGTKTIHLIEWLLSQKGINDSIENHNLDTPLMVARRWGHWIIVNKLTFASMGNKMREKSDEQIAKLNRNNGIIKQWFRFYNCDNIESDEYKSMVKMVESLKTLIKNRLPISDEMLLLVFHFEMKQNNNNPLECSLWKCLCNTLNEILRIPLNRRNWLWFKQYILNCSLWYQKVEEESKEENIKNEHKTEEQLLYHLLIKMVAKQLKAQKKYLEPYIDNLEQCETKDSEVSDDDSWEKLKNYKEFIVTDDPEGLRQDRCIEAGTNKELLPFPIRPIFNNDQLRKLNKMVKEFDCHNHYNVHGYLSKLILTAHSLNKTFHEIMKSIFEIDDETSSNSNGSLVYHEGPVKRLVRSQAKAETDYAYCSYPSTAKIVDFIRCCLVYKNPQNLLTGIDKFVELIGNGKAGCLKKILRLKNMFLDNKRENNNQWDLYKYADIKMGVLMVHNGQSMIVEVQFLLDWMLKAKSLGHGLYEIERNKDFIFDVNTIMNIGSSKDNANTDKTLANAVAKGDENEIATLILNESPFDFMNLRLSGEGLIHIAVDSGNKKTVKFLLDAVQVDKTHDEFVAFINMKGIDGQHILHYCGYNGNIKLLKMLLNYHEIDVNVTEDFGETPLFQSIKWYKNKGIFNVLKNEKRCDLNITANHKQTMFLIACERCNDIEFIKRLWLSGHFKINDCDENKNTALISACYGIPGNKNVTEIVEFLLNIADIDINFVNNIGLTAIDWAISLNGKKIVNALYKQKGFDWKSGTLNKFAIACGKQDLEMVKLVLKLWPNIDVNGTMSGKTAVHRACMNKNINVLKFILDLKEIKPDICDANGYSAWLLVIEKGGFNYIEHIKVLFNRKDVDFNRKVNEMNVLDIAIKNCDTELMVWLKSNGFTPTNSV